jgi:hypothetical protein
VSEKITIYILPGSLGLKFQILQDKKLEKLRSWGKQR